MATPAPVVLTLAAGAQVRIGVAADFVPPVAPNPEFIASPLSGTTPLAVTFTNQSTGTYSALLWDFGDGQISASANPTHAYTSPGTFTVTLTLAWAEGTLSRTRSAYVAATAPAPVGFTAPPVLWGEIAISNLTSASYTATCPEAVDAYSLDFSQPENSMFLALLSKLGAH